MYTLLLSYHAKAPLIQHEFGLSSTKLIEEGIKGHKFFELTSGDLNHCVQAWEILKTACEKQYKYHNLN